MVIVRQKPEGASGHQVLLHQAKRSSFLTLPANVDGLEQ